MRIPLLLLTCLVALGLFAQSPEEKLAAYAADFPQEKVVLQFSKPAYLAGETIFYKAYVLSGYEPSSLSTNLYVEFYDGAKNRLDSQIVYLHHGSGDGSFNLPASLAEDVYYIRAYTRWMLNFSNDLQYLKPVPVYNPYSSQKLHQKPVQWTAKAFVEGNQLLDSAVANVAVRLFSTGSLPESWTGSLVEGDSNTPIANVTVYNNEIGEVRFLSFANKTYKLLLKDDQGNTQEVVLPAVKNSGSLLQIANYASTLRYSILFKNIASNGKGYKLIATYNQQPFYVSSITKSGGGITGSIDIKNLPPGLVQVTLFDEKSQPVSERLCFIHQQQLQFTEPVFTTDTFSVEGRGYNHWKVAIDTSTWPSYTIQVSDAAVLPTGDFLSAVYLTADLSAPVQNAGWYVTEVTDSKMAALQALLLTQEKKLVPWSTVLRQTPPAIRIQPERFLSVSGRVVKGNKPQPLRDMNLIIRAADSTLSFVQVKTDKEGTFVLEGLFFTDSLQIYYQPDQRKFLEGDVSIVFTHQNHHHPLLQTLPGHSYILTTRLPTDTLPLLVQKAVKQRQQELLLAEKNKMLEAVVVTARIKTKTEALDERLSSGAFKSQHAQIFDFVNDDQITLTTFNNVIEWMQGRVSGLTVSYQDNIVVPYLRNQRVQIYLDEMNISYDYVQNINPNDVAMIKVIQGGLMGGTGGGSIAIYTRRGDMPSGYSSPALPRFTLTGYRKFAAPVLSTAEQITDTTVGDDRTILFRHSLLPPDSQTGKTVLRFYNNDHTRKYRLYMTGFTAEGKLIYLEKVLP
ncbi:MAG TPA: hypothetical protein VGN63_04715 [Flavisolibacter sp.]|nr:hypothetical protein [Flavisolibacter sp.]